MDSLGGVHLQAYSTPTGEEQGLSALDYAAMNHDPFMFEHLHKTGKNVAINDVDEEGLTVVHRLTSTADRRTLTENRFSFFPFYSGGGFTRRCSQ